MLIDEGVLTYETNLCGDVIEESIRYTDYERYNDLIEESGLSLYNILDIGDVIYIHQGSD